MVETAVILPFFLLLFLGIFEYSRFVMIRNLADHAVREGARFAVVHTYDKTTDEVKQKATDFLAGQGGQFSPSPTIEVFEADPDTGANLGLWTDASFGEWIMVRITGTYRPTLPSFLLMPTTITVRAQAMMRCEAN